jgi:phage gp46-like protein
MSDLATLAPEGWVGGDLALGTGSLIDDGGLVTAVLLSLFTDRRAETDALLPDGGSDRRGWWGEVVPLVDDQPLGSRLWLLRREKETAAVITRARLYAEEALAWLVTSGAAASVTVDASVPRRGVLQLAITIMTPAAGTETYQYQWEWLRNAL